ARFFSRKSLGSKSRTSAARWLRNGDGSNRDTSVTADRCARSPHHRPSTVVPIGVMQPIPVITTRRDMSFTPNARGSNVSAPSPALGDRGQTSQRPARDAMNEHGPDHAPGHCHTNQRPRWPVPRMYDANMHTVVTLRERPLHFHPARDAAHVPIANRWSHIIDSHLRHPPRRPCHWPEWT